MQKSKRKIEQQNIWQRFYDEYFLLERDFRYEIDRAPRKVVARLKKYWQNNWLTGGIPSVYRYLTLEEKKHEELWSFYLRLPRNPCQIHGEIYLQDGLTIIEGKIEYVSDTLSVFKFATVFSLIILLFLCMGFYGAIFLSFIPSMLYFSVYADCKTSRQKLEEIYKFWEAVVAQEDAIIEREWEQFYTKAKNEDVSTEILKEKRK